MENFDLRKYLAKNRLLKEEIDFPEMEDEYRDTMEGAIERPEVYLQDIINTPYDKFDLSGYLEVEKAVDGGDYTKEKAINLMKQWAMAELYDLLPIDTFLNNNFDKVKEKIENIPSEFKIMGDSKVATAADGERGIDFSYDKKHMEELFGKNDLENPITTIKINGVTVHYNDYL